MVPDLQFVCRHYKRSINSCLFEHCHPANNMLLLTLRLSLVGKIFKLFQSSKFIPLSCLSTACLLIHLSKFLSTRMILPFRGMSISYRVLSIRAGSLSLVKCDLHVETCEQFSVKILAHATYALCDDPSSCHSHAPTRQEN